MSEINHSWNAHSDSIAGLQSCWDWSLGHARLIRNYDHCRIKHLAQYSSMPTSLDILVDEWLRLDQVRHDYPFLEP